MTTSTAPARDTDILLERLGLRVRSLRSNLAMTRRALATHARISERHLADLETGRGNISVRLLDRIAAALETEIADLLESAASRTPEESLVVEFVRALPADEQKQALQLLH
ncbi:MAG: helix-turn-helix domain-containing protein [Proteobacteria bacterium]|nr:helix-turn-helix domain-containing protein [Pseudomonadota bacterium]